MSARGIYVRHDRGHHAREAIEERIVRLSDTGGSHEAALKEIGES
jgi:hypothetical protein